MDTTIKPVDVDRRILLIRGQSVMLDSDLAQIYGIPTPRLNQAVKRNHNRFPEDFMFQLTRIELGLLSSQLGTPKGGRGGRRTLPFAFTEHGAVMLASVLNSRVAVAAGIQIVRAFNRMRRMLTANKELAAKLAELERKVESHDTQMHDLFDAIRGFLEPPPAPPRRIGFKPE